MSVILPSYNTAQYIGAALNSVFTQDYPNYEVIVVNDGSPDTPALERVLEAFSGRLTYIKKTNGGVASARNAGIRASSGELIATLDSDDLWEPGCLSRQITFFEQNPDVHLVYGNGVIFGGPEEGTLLMDVSPSHGEVTFEALVREQCCVPTSGALMRRESLFGVGLFDETLRWGEDFDLWLRIVKGGYRIAYHRDVVIRYRRHEGGVSSDPTTLLRYASKVLEKMLADFDLTQQEKHVAEETKRRFDARVLLFQGKAAFRNCDFPMAAGKLHSANQILRQPRLSIAVTLLRFCPRLAWHAHRLLTNRSKPKPIVAGA